MFGDLIQGIQDKKGQTTADRLTKRRQALLQLIAQEHPEVSGTVFLFAPVEPEHRLFIQDSSFFYFAGISEPAVVLTFGAHEPTVLHTPDFAAMRAKWVHSVDDMNEQTKGKFGIDSLEKTGHSLSSYQIDPYFSKTEYQHIIDRLSDMVSSGKTIFTIYPDHGRSSASVKMMIDRFAVFVPGLMKHIVDISPLIATLRRKKDMFEIEQMYQAINITSAAFEAATRILNPGVNEAELQAAIEYIFTEQGAVPAYPSIIGGGKRATILHYHFNREKLEKGDLVLIDAGAMYQHYCADITRVFPVSGKFSKQQRKWYEIVLETQQVVVEHARPGMWLSNPKQEDMSLQHIAMNYLKKQGCDQYFIHGIGHYLGLDVHDVGSRLEPLAEGDVITIEPGVYIPDESIGIRIEDNYWIVQGAEPVCLSEDIVKSVADIEHMVSQGFDK